jgi:hypothetical protein
MRGESAPGWADARMKAPGWRMHGEKRAGLADARMKAPEAGGSVAEGTRGLADA